MPGLSEAQVRALTPEQIAVLIPMKLANLKPTAIAAINPLAFKRFSAKHVMSSTQGFAESQWRYFTPEQISYLPGNVFGLLDPRKLNSLQFSRITRDQLGSLGLEHIKRVSNYQMANFPPEAFRALTPEQTAVISPKQLTDVGLSHINEISTRAMEAFSAEAKRIIDSKRK
jgi:hypothetical protein